jgi:outer membrane protein OmpA-like peptidoglycan-associated protein
MKKLINFIILSVILVGSANAQLKSLGPNVNSLNHEIRPLVSTDGQTLYFTVQGNVLSKYKDQQDIWMCKRDSMGEWAKAVRLPDYINSQRYNGVFWTSADGNTLIIRGRRNDKGEVSRGFSKVTKLENGDWSIPEPIKIHEYDRLSRGTYTGATFSPDMKVMIMYFTTEINGDMNDLWISRLNDSTGEYSTPIKLSLSEDDYDEISPYIAPDGMTMYYASDREGGFGSHDIWMTRRVDDTWQNWTIPVNMGEPINSKEWEAYLSIDVFDKAAYVTKNTKYTGRGKMGGADLAYVILPDSLLPLPIKPKVDTVYIHDTITIYVSDTITLTKTIPCDVLDTMSTEQLQKELVRYKILFDFGSSVLREDAYKKLDIVAKMMRNNPDMKIELGGHTDALGNSTRNQIQSQERAESAKSYLLSKGVPRNRIEAKGYGNKKPITNNKTDADRQINRRVDIKVLNQ